MKIRIKQSVEKLDIDIKLEIDADTLRVLKSSGFENMYSTLKTAAARGAVITDLEDDGEEGDEPEGTILNFKTVHETDVEDVEPEYIEIDRWQQSDVPGDYGDPEKIIFRRPTVDETADAVTWFQGFMQEWCRGWTDTAAEEPIDRMAYLRHQMVHNKLALKLKWVFWKEGSMNTAVYKALEHFDDASMWACFGARMFDKELAIEVTGQMLQVFSREVPELGVFYDHAWDRTFTAGE